MRQMKLYKKILLFILAGLFVAIGILCIVQAVYLQNLEVQEQIAKIGYYKSDVYLDYHRHLAMGWYCVGAMGFFMTAIVTGIITANN